MIAIDFTISMKTRFLDKDFAKSLDKQKQAFFAIAGKAVMTAARRNLKLAKRMRPSELEPWQQAIHKREVRKYNRGQRPDRPLLGKRKAKPGSPPFIHKKNSLLKTRTFFALAQDKQSVVIGPELIGRAKRLYKQGVRGLASVAELEQRFPFVEPGLQAVLPRIPQYLTQAANRRK